MLNVWLQWPIGLVLILAVAAGALVGAFKRTLHHLLPDPLPRGDARHHIADDGSRAVDDQSSTIGGIDNALVMAVVGERLLGVPLAFYYALIGAVVIGYVFDFTPLGARLLVVGRGREVARLNGIAVERIRFGALVTSGALAAVAGIVYAGVLGSADPYSGLNFLLPAFAAAYLGATAIQPGRFNPWGAMLAVYFLATGITGLTMLGIPLWVTNVFNGGALILAVTVSQLVRGREATDIG